MAYFDTRGLFGTTAEELQAQAFKESQARRAKEMQFLASQSATPGYALGMLQAFEPLRQQLMPEQQDPRIAALREKESAAKEVLSGSDLSTPEGMAEAASKLMGVGMLNEATELLKAAKQARTSYTEKFKVVGNNVWDNELGKFVEGPAAKKGKENVSIEGIPPEGFIRVGTSGKKIKDPALADAWASTRKSSDVIRADDFDENGTPITRFVDKRNGLTFHSEARIPNVSPAAEKRFMKITEEENKNDADLRRINRVLQELEGVDVKGGMIEEGFENLKQAIGGRNLKSYLKTEFENLKINELVAMLPPGPASDKDIAMAERGVPPVGATKEEMVRFLKVTNRLKMYKQKMFEYERQFIRNNGSPVGWRQAWKDQADTEWAKIDALIPLDSGANAPSMDTGKPNIPKPKGSGIKTFQWNEYQADTGV